jgi:hypothetical protein
MAINTPTLLYSKAFEVAAYLTKQEVPARRAGALKLVDRALR